MTRLGVNHVKSSAYNRTSSPKHQTIPQKGGHPESNTGTPAEDMLHTLRVERQGVQLKDSSEKKQKGYRIRRSS